MSKSSKGYTAQKYAERIIQVLIRCGIPEKHAQDCAANAVSVLVIMPEVDVERTIRHRLEFQRDNWGLRVSDTMIKGASKACRSVSRPTRFK